VQKQQLKHMVIDTQKITSKLHAKTVWQWWSKRN